MEFKSSHLDLPACARIAHLSGAAEHIQTVLWGMEEIHVLAEDGTSAKVLKHALLVR